MLPDVHGDVELSWHLIDSLVADEFDITMCQEMKVDHGFMVPLMTMWPGVTEWPIRAVPIAVNTVQHPIPSAARCYKLGKALGKAIESYPDDLKVVILGTGGMSHQLQGERAGFINKRFDTMFMEKLVESRRALARMSNAELVEQAGSEGVELIMWLAMRGAMTRGASVIHSHYHIPVSNTPRASSSSRTRRQRWSRSSRIMTGRTVLIVDDEDLLRWSLRERFLQDGARCSTAVRLRGDRGVQSRRCGRRAARLPPAGFGRDRRAPAHEDDVAERRRDPDDRVSDDRERRRRRDVRCMRLPGQAIRSR